MADAQDAHRMRDDGEQDVQPTLRMPLRTAAVFALVGGLWILFTDRLLEWLVPDPGTQRLFQTYKGWFFVLMTATLIYGLIARDIRRLRRSGRALQNSESRMRALVSHLPDGVAILDADGIIRDLTEAGLAMLEVAEATDAIGTTLAQWVSAGPDLAGLMTAPADRPSNDLVCEVIGRQGGRRWCALRAVGMAGPQGEPGWRLVLLRDATQGKLAEMRLQRLTRLYSVQGEINRTIVRLDGRASLFQMVCRILVDIGGLRFAWFGRVDEDEGRVQPFCNQGMEAGYLDGIVITIHEGAESKGPAATSYKTGRPVIIDDIAEDPTMVPWRQAATDRGYRAAAAFPVWERGRVQWVMCLYATEPGFFDASEVELLETIAADLTYALAALDQEQQRRSAERALAEETERLAVTLRGIGDGVITTDVAGHVVLMNKIAEDLTGFTRYEAVGKPLKEIYRVIGERNRQAADTPITAIRRSGGPVDFTGDRLLIARSGREISITDSGSPVRNPEGAIIGVVVAFRDITDRRRLEAEQLKSRNLESLGVLAGGIAHDFNNLLGAILGSVSLALALADPADRIRKRLSEAEKACLRAKDLTQQLMTFAKGGLPRKQSVMLADLIAESVTIASINAHSRCEWRIEPTTWSVSVDEGQISQVLTNLILNADQASPDGARITIRAGNADPAAGPVGLLGTGRYVTIAISDSGSGIPAEDLPKIFDPYFTTKERGNGLGLASAYTIVRNHDGHIDVTSSPGAGTTFTIYLPASAEAPPNRSGVKEDTMIGGNGRILVMDDTASIRELLGEMLDFLGYEAAFAVEGSEALTLYETARASAQPFAAVIMDLTVPGGMGGKEAIQGLLAIDPETRVIVSSGYSNDPIMSDYERFGFKAVIAKPFQLADLGRVLAGVLGAPA